MERDRHIRQIPKKIRHGWISINHISVQNSNGEASHFNKRKMSYTYWRENTELSVLEGTIIVYRENPREPTIRIKEASAR